jgi:hypothetical protein
MIRNVAELLRDLQRREMELIADSGITHAPTIGDQYEGLTKAILERAIPSGLQLQVVSGFVEGVDGSLSGQIDCMLVQGEGKQIPYSTSYKWPVEDVLAVFEVKKTLFGEELSDANSQLKTVFDRFLQHEEQLTEADKIDITPSLYVYGQIVGKPAPQSNEPGTLSFQEEIILRTLITEQIAPVRIIFGYQGYANEYTLRAGFIKYLQSRNNMVGYAGIAMPHLIVCGNNSLIKFNGHPYLLQLRRDGWVWYGSSTENPLLLLLNLILTKLMYVAAVPGWFETDLALEHFTPLLVGRAVKTGDASGVWSYTPVLFTQRQLKRAADQLQQTDWEPLNASPFQCTLVALVGKGISRESLNAIAKEFPDADVETEVEELRKHGILGWADDKLKFLTIQCVTLFGPAGQPIIGDAEDPRYFEWFRRERQKRAAGKIALK